MDKERLFRYLERGYFSKREIMPHLPLGVDPDEIWEEMLQSRREKGIILPLTNGNGDSYWYLLTNKMIAASEVIVDELMEHDTASELHQNTVSTIEEIYYTGFLEGAQISVQDAMAFLQNGEEPGSPEELILLNSRQAAGFAAENMYHAIDRNYLHNLAYFLTEGLDNGGGGFRMTDSMEIPSMQGEPILLPSADRIPEQASNFTGFLADTKTHPLIKAAAAQAWVLAVRPFPEGNERLARLLSNVILIRAGYRFFGEISISSVIARTSYDYFRAIANILRPENGADLTYFLEYYMTALSGTVHELRARLERQETETIETEKQMAVVPLASVTETADTEKISKIALHEKRVQMIESALDTLYSQGMEQFVLADIGKLTGIDKKTIRKLLLPYEENKRIYAVRKSRAGNIYAFHPVQPSPDSFEIEDDMNVQSDIDLERKDEMLSSLKVRIAVGTENAATVAKELIQHIESGRYQFTSEEIAQSLSVSIVSVRNSLRFYLLNHLIRTIGNNKNFYIYEFCFVKRNQIGASSNSTIQYSESILELISRLENSDSSPKDRRIGKMLQQYLSKGIITKQDYASAGEESKWQCDMQFAAQLGLVERINYKEYRILTELDTSNQHLLNSQKNTLSILYDLFGEDSFSAEMAIANLDYSSAHICGILHKFTWMKLLDCTVNDDNTYRYQLNVNPIDNPEYFGEVA